MKKSSTMQGTLNKLFGKKNSNNNSLYAENPPWILSQGSKKGSGVYPESTGSFSFLDDSGTATLKSRPGPRVRPVLQFSNSNTENQGLAVPTPSIPGHITDNGYMGTGPKLNGNYRMYSSVGDLRQSNYYDDYLNEEIPAPPSMPPPPPPSMPPPPPPKESPPSSAVSSPASPSPPDFIPPTPNSSVPVIVAPVPPTIMSVGDHHQQQAINSSKWKSETLIHSLPTDGAVGLPNRFSLNPTVQHKQEQLNYDAESNSSLPRSFKVPPPAPARISSMMQYDSMFPQSDYTSTIGAKELPSSPVRSSFNPSVQAKLFSATTPGQKPLHDTLNKRRSMLIMEDPQTVIEKGATTTSDSEREDQFYSDVRQVEPELNLSSMISAKTKDEANPRPSSAVFNKLFNRDGSVSEGFKSLRPTVQITPVPGTNMQSNDDSLTWKQTNEVHGLQSEMADYLDESPPTSPPTAPPPPPPIMALPKPPTVSPPSAPSKQHRISSSLFTNTSNVDPTAAPPFPIPSPSLAKKNGQFPGAPSVVPPPPPPPPKALPPIPPPASPSNRTLQQPLLKALQAREESLKQIQRRDQTIEIKPAQPLMNQNDNDDHKNRVGKIKEELESLLSSPKKEEQKSGTLRNTRPGLEGNRKPPPVNNPQFKSGENTLVNSLMLKVPLMPPTKEKDDTELDNSEWLPKSNQKDIEIPEPDYLPVKKSESSIPPKSPMELPKSPVITPSLLVPPSPPKPTNVSLITNSPLLSYKAHNHQRKASAGSWTIEPESPKFDRVQNEEKDNDIKPVETLSSKSTYPQESPISQTNNELEYPVTGDKIEAGSPMALLLAAKKRAQRGPPPSADHTSLPKVSVTNGFAGGSFPTQNRDGTNTFVVVPNQENREPISPATGLSSLNYSRLTFNSNNDSGTSLSNSSWRDVQTLDKPPQSKEVLDDQSTQYDRNTDKGLSTTQEILYSRENYWNSKSTEPFQHRRSLSKIDTDVSEHKLHQNDSLAFNISTFPSPAQVSKPSEDLEFSIIPPPAEFMNSPEQRSNAHRIEQLERSNFMYDDRAKSDFGRPNNSFVSLTESKSDYNRYPINNYSTSVSRDVQKGSLIKKRLYMPEPEVPRNYAFNASSLRTAGLPLSYGHMQVQSSSNMMPDPRTSTAPPSRYLAQGRRLSSENFNRMAPVNDMRYKPQNQDYTVNKATMSRSQITYPGMTFTVRPGTRQPISNTYQGGYL